MSSEVLYAVTATLRDRSVLQEYVDWLKNGHVQGVIAGGALTASIVVLDQDGVDAETPRVESVYTFASRESLQAYFDGPALILREEGKALFIDTGKVSFARRIGDIVFAAQK